VEEAGPNDLILMDQLRELGRHPHVVCSRQRYQKSEEEKGSWMLGIVLGIKGFGANMVH
jgi:hypothetical protein